LTGFDLESIDDLLVVDDKGIKLWVEERADVVQDVTVVLKLGHGVGQEERSRGGVRFLEETYRDGVEMVFAVRKGAEDITQNIIEIVIVIPGAGELPHDLVDNLVKLVLPDVDTERTDMRRYFFFGAEHF